MRTALAGLAAEQSCPLCSAHLLRKDEVSPCKKSQVIATTRLQKPFRATKHTAHAEVRLGSTKTDVTTEVLSQGNDGLNALQISLHSKRAVLFGLLGLLPPLLQPCDSHAALLKSLNSQRPSTLTFFNKTSHAVKIYWYAASCHSCGFTVYT